MKLVFDVYRLPWRWPSLGIMIDCEWAYPIDLSINLMWVGISIGFINKDLLNEYTDSN